MTESGPSLKATIRNWENLNRLGKTITEYTMVVEAAQGTSALTWEVYKTYSDFVKLHKQLRDAAPDAPLPRLPPSALVGYMEEGFIQNRMVELTQYLNALAALPEVWSSPAVLGFFGALDSSDLKLSLDAVVELADVGDLFLFRTDGLLQSVQRRVTASAYDHVGIVVAAKPTKQRRLKGLDLYLLEATMDGVRKYPLRRRLRAWHLSGAVAVHRQLVLLHGRTDDLTYELWEFAKEVDGKPYSLSPSKFLRKLEGTRSQGYFCSELVASAYKRMGILPKDVCASDLMPVNFATSSELKLINGARLEAEVVVDFHVPEMAHATLTTTTSQ